MARPKKRGIMGAGMETPDVDTTRDRLLAAAEVLFAQKGYHAVSIREITSSAESNLAAVNYHFGNKENLYLEVFKSRWVVRAHRIRAAFEKKLAQKASPGKRDVFLALAEAFLKGPLDDEERLCHVQLIQREITDPTAAFQVISKEVLQPFLAEIGRRVGAHFSPELTEEELNLNVLSMLSMVLYFNFARTAVSGLTGRDYDDAFKDRLVRHIADFSQYGFGKERGA